MLARIRKALGVTGQEIVRNATVDDRMRRAPKGVIPARAQLPPPERVALFISMAEKVFATIARVDRPDEVPAAVADFLRSHILPAKVRTGEDLRLIGLPWKRTALAVTRGPTAGNDPVGVSHAIAGIAETGTVVLASGRDNPTTLAFQVRMSWTRFFRLSTR